LAIGATSIVPLIVHLPPIHGARTFARNFRGCGTPGSRTSSNVPAIVSSNAKPMGQQSSRKHEAGPSTARARLAREEPIR
jgi:hypothetical protein